MLKKLKEAGKPETGGGVRKIPSPLAGEGAHGLRHTPSGQEGKC
ncbi:MAG: hypothetical protein QGH98_00270 [Nitrospinaceae bacterium]|jgi:hypothetical protein|nr:hypothetical protein [Nitrospinaceae bacterium]|tara:strand:+ start:6099 stop:6230 length:132 start_codon:yes stop_codon:yes gene_type:complete